HLLEQFDYIIIHKNGRIIDSGTFEHMNRYSIVLKEMMQHQMKTENPALMEVASQETYRYHSVLSYRAGEVWGENDQQGDLRGPREFMFRVGRNVDEITRRKCNVNLFPVGNDVKGPAS